jgi:hypothetical protein
MPQLNLLNTLSNDSIDQTHIARFGQIIPEASIVANQALLLVGQLLPAGTQHFQLALRIRNLVGELGNVLAVALPTALDVLETG